MVENLGCHWLRWSKILGMIDVFISIQLLHEDIYFARCYNKKKGNLQVKENNCVEMDNKDINSGHMIGRTLGMESVFSLPFLYGNNFYYYML